MRAYQEFAKRCDLQPYRKLVSLLVSGQKIGNRNLMDKLEEEAERVFLERKNTARKLGEEASTKLLIPMMLMLMVVMGIDDRTGVFINLWNIRRKQHERI